MTTKHTPGPWKVNGNIGRKSELGIVANAAPCIIAIMGNQKEWPVEAQANAELIARAPELLADNDHLRAVNAELVKAFKPLISHSEISCDSHGGRAPITCHRCREREHARAALAKAKGEA